MIDSERDISLHRSVVAKVLGSVTFHKATRLKQLLRYLCEQELAGRGGELREHDIGVHVFGRSESFEPSEDSIVRASVRQLRAKLLEYYSTEGADALWQIDIPKGSYVPVFLPRQAPPGAAVPPLRNPQDTPTATPKSEHPWIWVVSAATVTAVATAAFFLGMWVSSAKEKDVAGSVIAAEGTGSVMEQFLASSEGPVRFVPSDSVINLLRSFSGRALTLEAYESKSFFAGANRAAQANPEHWEAMVSRELMNIGDASIVLRTARDYPEHANRLLFRQSRDLKARDLKEGNFVFLGSAVANPWLELFDDSLNFRISGPADTPARQWRNCAPQEGESMAYPATSPLPQAERTVSYAQVAVIPNKSRSGKVLIVAGLLMPDTEAAGEFVLSNQSAKTISNTLGVKDLTGTPYFEVILETRKTGAAWTVTRAVASRTHPGEPASTQPPVR